MKIEVLAARHRRTGHVSLRDRLVAYLPRYAPSAARLAPLMNARNWLPGVAKLAERVTGFSAQRKLPVWRGKLFRLDAPVGEARAGEVALFADTFNTYFEPESLWESVEVLIALGYRVHPLSAADSRRPVCCGRTFLSAGLVDEARTELRRMLEAARPLLDKGIAIVGLEPSCVLTFRDEATMLGMGDEVKRLAGATRLLDEFIAGEAAAGRIKGPIGRREGRILLHGHCHQKSFGTMEATARTLRLIEGLEVETIETSCCGMAGAFGYGADTYNVSISMAEASLLPAIRKAPEKDVVASGFSCRHQISDGTGRTPLHLARILAEAIKGGAAGVAPP